MSELVSGLDLMKILDLNLITALFCVRKSATNKGTFNWNESRRTKNVCFGHCCTDSSMYTNLSCNVILPRIASFTTEVAVRTLNFCFLSKHFWSMFSFSNNLNPVILLCAPVSVQHVNGEIGLYIPSFPKIQMLIDKLILSQEDRNFDEKPT